MASSSASTGRDFLAKKSGVIRASQGVPNLKDVVIVEDENLDADRLLATLRVMFGYDLQVRCASTLAAAVDLVIERAPEIVFLDDV